jgi:hypothetical protein
MPDKLITHSFSQETACTAWNLKARVATFMAGHHRSCRELDVLSLYPVSVKIFFKINLLFMCCISSSDPFPSGFPTKTLYVFPISPICVTCPVSLIHP